MLLRSPGGPRDQELIETPSTVPGNGTNSRKARLETQSSRRRAGAAATAAGLTVAVALVAMAGRAPLARSTPVNASSASAPTTALLTLLAGAGIVMLGALAVLLWQNRRRRGDDDDELETQPLQVHWIWQLLSILFALAVGGALVAAAVIGTRSHNAVPTFAPGGGRPPTALTTANGSGAGFVLPDWLPWTVLGIVVVALAVGVVALVRWLNPPVDASSERTAASAAVEAAIGALEDSSDPRDAVIRAYAAMQGTLAAHGVVRSPSEAPREYLRRVLVANAGSEREARTLTGLFEEARFSTHPISERVRQIALAALGSLRARLGADGTAG